MYRILISALIVLSSSPSFAEMDCRNLFIDQRIDRDRYPWLEQDSLRRREWRSDQNQRTLADLSVFTPIKAIRELVRSILDKPHEMFKFKLKNNSQIFIQDQGLAKPKDVVLQRPNGGREVLFHTYEWKRNSTFNFVGMSHSSDERFLAVTAAENGTIDDFRVIIYDLKQRKMITDQLSMTHRRPVVVEAIHNISVPWLSPNQFAVSSESGMLTYNIVTDDNHPKEAAKVTWHHEPNSEPIHSIDGAALVRTKNGYRIHQSGFPIITFDQLHKAKEIISVDSQNIFVLAEGPAGAGEILRMTRDSQDPSRVTKDLLIPESPWVTSKATKLGKILAVERYWGPDRRIDLYDVKTKRLTQSITLPGSSSLISVKWKTPGSQLELGFASPVIESRTYTFDLNSKSFLEADPENDMMTLDAVEYKTEYIMVPSKDGTLVPTRLVYRKDLRLNGSNPGLAYTYGGFGVLGYLFPSYNALNLQYIKRGGVLVNPGVRGGVEYGETWHQAGMLSKKQNVIDDLNSVIEYVQTRRYISPTKTTSTGWSNGGMVVAAAALQRPDLYALVIPGNGVQDYLSAYKIDARYHGWQSEYGDPRTSDRDFMKLLAPVELAQNPKNYGPKYLIPSGTKDSRVNQADSDKLAYAAQLHSPHGNVFLMPINNSGHWMTSPLYQDIIAWAALSKIWAQIFSVSQMNVE